MMELSNDVATVTLNVRYPISYTSENVYEGVEKTLEGTNIGLIKKGDDKPAYVPVDDPFIQTLCSVYVEETGDDENKPFEAALTPKCSDGWLRSVRCSRGKKTGCISRMNVSASRL